MDALKTTDKLFRLPWYRQVKFKALFAVTTLFLMLMWATTELTRVSGARLLEDRAKTQLAAAAQQLETEIARRTDKAEILAKLIASLSAKTSHQPALLRQLIPELIDQHDAEHLIAGGGVWPEPRQFDKTKVRNSFFWGRNPEGELQYYDDYNDPSGAGYHNEEWYVPGQHLQENRVYWSRSYTDPYSQQAMVTVTAPIYRQDAFVGVATIDLKLEGLQETLRNATTDFNGYAIAVDKHGQFLSLSDTSMTEHAVNDELASFTTLHELTTAHPQFMPVAHELQKNHYISENTLDKRVIDLAIALEQQSYQINASEAVVIARELLRKNTQSISRHHFRTAADHLFEEPSRSLALSFPDKGWHIVMAMPESYAQAFINRQISYLNLMIGLFMFSTLVVTAIMVDKQITNPLNRLTRQLRESAANPRRFNDLVKVDDNSEFGELAERFNQRTRELIESHEKVEQLALYDPLTSLPNRILLTEYLETLLEENSIDKGNKPRNIAVMFIDIDNFKTINDSLGHAVGDQLLVQLAQRLTDACRSTDFIARHGGDEFIAVVSENRATDNPEEAPTRMARRITNALDKPFLLNGSEYHISASIGIALNNSGNIDELLKHADSAMYHVKEDGRNGWCFFEKSMQVRADERLQIESDLRDAIANNSLQLAYQPQVNANNECIGLEALLRWEHPSLGNIPPVKFITIAEESMLITALGKWVMRTACQQIVEWLDQGVSFDHVAVNISPRQIQDEQFVATVKQILGETGAPTAKLMLEITEGVIIDCPEKVIETMQQLKMLGIRWSIDDFGTGYSSLTYLKRLPLDELKIDKSFVDEVHHNPSDEAIVETIISIAQKFGFKTIAEGVETEQQRQLLLSKGCEQFQGYLFSPPLLGEALDNFLIPRLPDNNQHAAGML